MRTLATTEPTGEHAPPHPVVLVLHGARGDLARRSVYPALGRLQHERLLPAAWALIGTGREDISDDEFDTLVRESLDEFGDPEHAETLTRHTTFTSEVGEDDAGGLPEAVAEERQGLADATGRAHA